MKSKSWRLDFKLKKILLLISFTLSVLNLKKYLILRCLLMKRTLLKKNWYEKIQNKLEINVDLFSNEQVKLNYIHSRLFDDAVEITQARCKQDCVNLYKIINDLLKELTQLFNDSNKKVNFHKEYYNLIQEFKKFNEFYTQFQRLFFYLDYHKKQLIADLKDKIHFHL